MLYHCLVRLKKNDILASPHICCLFSALVASKDMEHQHRETSGALELELDGCVDWAVSRESRPRKSTGGSMFSTGSKLLQRKIAYAFRFVASTIPVAM
jgi:hypothetical protein